MRRRLIPIIIFAVIICLPGGLQLLSYLTGDTYDITTEGYEADYEKPVFSVDNWFMGYYQSLYSDWVDHVYPLRGVLIKSKNQIDYSLFRTGNGIIGKNGDIYQDFYINAELSLDEKNRYQLPENQEKLREYVAHLESIERKLNACGKHLFFYLTPSKAHYYRDNIPWKYYAMQDEGENIPGYIPLSALLAESELTHLDANDLQPDIADTADFYTTGIHWSRIYEQRVDAHILEMLSAASGEDYGRIVIGDMHSSDEPYWRDSDVQDLLNIYTHPDLTYYEYDSFLERGGDSVPLHAFIQGGSFSEGLMHDYFDLTDDSTLYYCFYDNYVRDYQTGEDKPFDDWSEVDLQTILDDSDWVIIELNEAMIADYSSGFAEYLDAYLDTYVPHQATDTAASGGGE